MSTDQHYQEIKQYIHKYIFDDDGRKESELYQSNFQNNCLFQTRLISFLMITGIYIWSILVVQISLFQNFMYLTMIGYFLTWLFFTMTNLSIIFNKTNIKSQNFNIYTEIVFQLAFCLGLPITIVFWAFLFQVVLNIPGVTTQTLIIYGFLHALPLICLIVEFIQNKFTFSIKHLPVLIVVQILYAIINITYSVAVTPIYKPITWQNVGSYLIALGSVLITFLFHYIGRIIYKKCKQSQTYPLLNANQSQNEAMQSQNHTKINNQSL